MQYNSPYLPNLWNTYLPSLLNTCYSRDLGTNTFVLVSLPLAFPWNCHFWPDLMKLPKPVLKCFVYDFLAKCFHLSPFPEFHLKIGTNNFKIPPSVPGKSTLRYVKLILIFIFNRCNRINLCSTRNRIIPSWNVTNWIMVINSYDIYKFVWIYFIGDRELTCSTKNTVHKIELNEQKSSMSSFDVTINK